MFPQLPHSLYYVTVALQAICVIHCLRSGNQNKWIWVIVFLPVLGSILYFFMEVLPGRTRHNLQTSLGSLTKILANPAARVRRLEENLRFTDTFNNRVMLADAYLSIGRTDEAIELYTGSLTGAFTENEHVMTQLIRAYFSKQRYEELVMLARKVYSRPQFARSTVHVLYAQALERIGNMEEAEREFRKMKVRFSCFEARYQYGLFLLRAGRTEEARFTFGEIKDEAYHLSARERRDNRSWINRAKEELKKMSAASMPA